VYLQAPETWIAECIDLDLMADGRAATIAMEGLHDAMASSLKTAGEGDKTGLVPRPSPFTHRLRYHWFCLRAAFSTGRHNFRLLDCSSEQLPICA
jgi:hypothetical protein